jgi:GR25 family glycosyltransferase involved in LPS biosynthesis
MDDYKTGFLIWLFFGVVVFFIWFIWRPYLESMTTPMEPLPFTIQYTVIHLKTNNKRKSNIVTNKKILGQPIRIFDAICGTALLGTAVEDKLSLDNLQKSLQEYDTRLVNQYKFKQKNIGQIGCYLSHFLIIRDAAVETAPDYTVVFEDDFTFTHGKTTHGEIIEVLQRMREHDPMFGIVMLGTYNAESSGAPVQDNIYEFDRDPRKQIYGTYGYIINKQTARVLYEYLLTINTTIDCQIFNLIRDRKITGYVVKPHLVDQTGDPTTILMDK